MRLQLALDMVDLSRAVKVAEMAADYVDLLEAGTPLIKSVGLSCVRELKGLGKEVVADMKTMDAGYLEVKVAAEMGADIVSVLGVASDRTVREAVRAGKDHDIGIMADLMGVRDILGRAKELESMGVDFVIVHTGLDEQLEGMSPFSHVDEVRREVSTGVAVAGGIRPEDASRLSGVDVVIVGGYITRSEDPKKAAERMRGALHG